MGSMGDFRGEATAIECDVISTEVVTLDDNGAQQRGRIGLAIQITRSLVEGVPEDCPLTFPAAHRTLAMYATCLSCEHSDATAETVITEPSHRL